MFDPTTPPRCPPKDAEPPHNSYLRFVFHDPPTAEDFIIWINEPQNRRLLAERQRLSDCRAFAVSMLSEDARTRLEPLFLRQMRKKAKVKRTGFLGLAKVKLDANSGLIKKTGKNPYHYDLWPYCNSDLEENIVSVEEM